jgi:hypothetical protein
MWSKEDVRTVVRGVKNRDDASKGAREGRRQHERSGDGVRTVDGA